VGRVTEYPIGWETSAVLGDGSTVDVRPIRPDDVERLRAFHSRQSPESIYFRFFQYRPELSSRELEFFTNVDYERRMAFVAILRGELVAVARYETLNGQNKAEVAFFVDDGFTGRGLATLMLEYLAAAGRRRGLDGFTASVLPENFGMLRVFRNAGFDVSTAFEDGAIAVTLGIEVTEQTSAAIAAREQRAHARSVARILEPSSVAVIGAGRRPESVGHQLLQRLVAAPFNGAIHVVNPAGEVIAGIPSVESVADLPPGVDLAIVVAPSAAVESIVADCAAVGVGGLVIISAGFAEAGPEGARRQLGLVRVARDHGLRLIGPNAFGVANTDPAVQLHALFLDVDVPAGPVGLLSQSGPLGAVLLASFSRIGVGVSTFAAVGNRADVSVNDLLQYWASDGRTDAIALYLENVGNLAKFTRIARSVSMHKPIVAVATSNPGINELLRQSGVIMVDEVGELAEQTGVAIDQPLPGGSRVAVITNASSVGRLAAAACRRAGLDVVVPSGADRSDDTDSIVVGDVDNLVIGHDAAPADYERAVVAAAVSAEVDAVFLAVVPTPMLSPAEAADLLGRIDRAVDKPMVATGLSGVDRSQVSGLPLFDFPEGAARSLGRWVQHAAWRRTERGEPIRVSQPDVVSQHVMSLLGEADRVALSLTEAQDLLRLIGIDLEPANVGRTANEVVEAAAALGYPVALKAGGVADRVAGEGGGTALDLHDEAQLLAAFHRMAKRFPTFLPALVQPMVPTGRHLRVELVQDTDTGARIAVGPGGINAADLPLAAVQVLPAGSAEIEALARAALAALHATEELNTDAFTALLSCLAGAAGLLPELHRVELNPVLLSAGRAVAIECNVELRRVSRRPLDDVRHL
jgi:acyl-CoA synthetase (NDP forming)/RimJ/RimL family protein N-acetyltransferase